MFRDGEEMEDFEQHREAVTTRLLEELRKHCRTKTTLRYRAELKMTAGVAKDLARNICQIFSGSIYFIFNRFCLGVVLSSM